MNLTLRSRHSNVKTPPRLCNFLVCVVAPRRKATLIHAQEEYHVVLQSLGGVQGNQIEVVGGTSLARKCRNCRVLKLLSVVSQSQQPRNIFLFISQGSFSLERGTQKLFDKAFQPN